MNLLKLINWIENCLKVEELHVTLERDMLQYPSFFLRKEEQKSNEENRAQVMDVAAENRMI